MNDDELISAIDHYNKEHPRPAISFGNLTIDRSDLSIENWKEYARLTDVHTPVFNVPPMEMKHRIGTNVRS